jgi:hypothetical protein
MLLFMLHRNLLIDWAETSLDLSSCKSIKRSEEVSFENVHRLVSYKNKTIRETK